MRIAIPVDENKSDVAWVFARAPFFLVWEDGKAEMIANPAEDAESGAGVQVAQILVDSKIDVLITPRCGQNASEVFKACGIEIYKSAERTKSLTALANITAFQNGELEKLTHFHGGFQGIS